MSVKELVSIIKNGWLTTKNHRSPDRYLVYEPQHKSYYFVVDDKSPIIELIDEEGNLYIVPKSNCRRMNNGIYHCSNVEFIHDYPLSDREFFVWETIIPLVEEEYNLV